MIRHHEDHLTEKRAEAQARSIREYWAQRGAIVRAWVEPDRIRSAGRPFFVVRSNLINGLPERWA